MNQGHDRSQERLRQQIDRLLQYPRVRALNAGAIARNLAVGEDQAQEMQDALDTLVAEGQAIRTDDGAFVARWEDQAVGEEKSERAI